MSNRKHVLLMAAIDALDKCDKPDNKKLNRIIITSLTLFIQSDGIKYSMYNFAISISQIAMYIHIFPLIHSFSFPALTKL